MGINSKKNAVREITKIKIDDKITQIDGGRANVCCLTAENTIYTFGDNKRGQCGIKPDIVKCISPHLHKGLKITYHQPMAFSIQH